MKFTLITSFSLSLTITHCRDIIIPILQIRKLRLCTYHLPIVIQPVGDRTKAWFLWSYIT